MSIIEKFNQKLYEPASASFIGWTRIVILFVLLYKFLSRDFSVYADIPIEALGAYAFNVYNPLDGYALLGIKPIVDLFSFHWLHWVVPFPIESIIYYIQLLLEAMIIMAILFGGGYKKINYLLIYVLGMYLFGYLFRTGSDIDAVFIQMQIVLLLFLFRGQETYILFGKQQNPLAYSRENGWFFSMVLLIFIGYYFLAGVTKIVDISLFDWARFELANLSEINKLKQELGADRAWCFLREPMIGNSWLDLPGTAMIYLEHISVIFLFFKRKYIAMAWFIYLFLHLGTLTVNILFLGVILSWLVFLPIHRFYQKVVIVWDGDCSFCKKSVDIVKKFDWFNRFIIINSKDKEKNDSNLISGWDGDINKGLWSKGFDSNENNVGFDGFRRMVWVMPIFWIFLPFLYLPFIPTLGRYIYGCIAKNRYRLGCNSSNCSI